MQSNQELLAIIDIARGSSKYSISMVAKSKQVHRAIEAIHVELDELENGV